MHQINDYIIVSVDNGQINYRFWDGADWITDLAKAKQHTYPVAFLVIHEVCPEPLQGSRITAVPLSELKVAFGIL